MLIPMYSPTLESQKAPKLWHERIVASASRGNVKEKTSCKKKEREDTHMVINFIYTNKSMTECFCRNSGDYPTKQVTSSIVFNSLRHIPWWRRSLQVAMKGNSADLVPCTLQKPQKKSWLPSTRQLLGTLQTTTIERERPFQEKKDIFGDVKFQIPVC